MTDHSLILQTLADGDIHSGEELSALLGVSRTAVWKQLGRMQEETGLQLDSIKGKGYRLEGGIELLDHSRIISLLSASAKPLLAELNLLGRTNSTNSVALQCAQQGAGSGYVVVAEQQLAGRGRRGRQWISPYGCNIYCSTVWQFEGGAASLEGLSLAVGVAVARALAASGLDEVQLKWPNDVLWRGRKLAGILLEMIGDAAGHCQVVVGIGINVSMGPESEGGLIDQPWTSASAAAGHSISRNQLLANLLSELLPLLERFAENGFVEFRDAWSGLDAMRGKDVSLHAGDQIIVGRAAGVAENGALAIETAAGCQWFHGGEVSLRLLDDTHV
jgi:BirA family biotin operon repressor/biotin-[acetyl-CoA-carboxylase] ligase